MYFMLINAKIEGKSFWGTMFSGCSSLRKATPDSIARCQAGWTLLITMKLEAFARSCDGSRQESQISQQGMRSFRPFNDHRFGPHPEQMYVTACKSLWFCLCRYVWVSGHTHIQYTVFVCVCVCEWYISHVPDKWLENIGFTMNWPRNSIASISNAQSESCKPIACHSDCQRLAYVVSTQDVLRMLYVM